MIRLDLGEGYGVREFRPGDRSSLVEQANDIEVARYLEDRFPHPYTLADADRWLGKVSAQDPMTHFAIVCGGGIAGGIGFQGREDVYRRTVEIGYWLGRKHWGKGVATRAVTTMSRWMFENFQVERIQARIFAANTASMRVLEKAGYQLEGRLRRSVIKHGVFMDQMVYAILRSEVEAVDHPRDRNPRFPEDSGALA